MKEPSKPELELINDLMEAVESPKHLEILKRQSKKADLLFNIKITDLSDLENPFVIYENKGIDDEGYIIFDHLDAYGTAHHRILPWLSN